VGSVLKSSAKADHSFSRFLNCLRRPGDEFYDDSRKHQGEQGPRRRAGIGNHGDQLRRDVHRRVGSAIAVATVTLGVGALMALTKSKKHFVGLTWSEGDQKGGLAMQCDKNEYRGVLAGLEGIGGKKAVDSTTMTVKN
jgi:hypothetical protein